MESKTQEMSIEESIERFSVDTDTFQLNGQNFNKIDFLWRINYFILRQHPLFNIRSKFLDGLLKVHKIASEHREQLKLTLLLAFTYFNAPNAVPQDKLSEFRKCIEKANKIITSSQQSRARFNEQAKRLTGLREYLLFSSDIAAHMDVLIKISDYCLALREPGHARAKKHVENCALKLKEFWEKTHGQEVTVTIYEGQPTSAFGLFVCDVLCEADSIFKILNEKADYPNLRHSRLNSHTLYKIDQIPAVCTAATTALKKIRKHKKNQNGP
jgi:hypothetical protein